LGLLAMASLLSVSCQSAAWVPHKNPQGFSLEAPAGWQVAGDRNSGRVTVSGPARQQAVIWPVFIPGAVNGRTAPAILSRLVASAGVRANWSAPQQFANGVRAFGRDGDRAVTASFAWAPSPKGAAGFLYIAAAPEASYRAEAENITHIFQTFRATGAPAGMDQPAAPRTNMNWTRFQDPKENAFSLETPAGWRTTGGATRMASVDVRKAVTTVSPDGKIRITGGDAELPAFTEPNQMLEMTGFHEGSWYSPGYGVNQIVRRYMTGTQFAREYVTRMAAKDCANINFTDAKDRPDVDAPLNRLVSQLASVGGLMQIHSGEVRFTCTWNGQPAAGYYFAGSLRSGAAGTPVSIWHIEYLYGYLAARDQEPAAQSIMGHMLATYKDNPEWMAMQSRTTAATSRIVSQTQDAVSKMISDTFDYKNRSGDEVSRRRENSILGTVDVVDPNTGEQFKVENSGNYFWLDNRGTIVGTETSTTPGWDFREMVARP
jgi:hypothetical protein